MPSAWQNLRKWRKLIKPGPTVEGAVFQLTNGTGEDRYFFFAGAGLAAGFGWGECEYRSRRGPV